MAEDEVDVTSTTAGITPTVVMITAEAVTIVTTTKDVMIATIGEGIGVDEEEVEGKDGIANPLIALVPRQRVWIPSMP